MKQWTEFVVVLGVLMLMMLGSVMAGPAVADHVMTVLREVETNPARAKTVIASWWAIGTVVLLGAFGMMYLVLHAKGVAQSAR